MFDCRDLFQWERFITPAIVKIFYWLAVGISVLFGLSGILSGFALMSLHPLGGVFWIVGSLIGIVIGSTFKGLIVGLCAGYFARKVHSVPLGILFGLGVGMLLAFGIAAMPGATGEHYYFAIMLPGSILGAVVGYATQKYQRQT